MGSDLFFDARGAVELILERKTRELTSKAKVTSTATTIFLTLNRRNWLLKLVLSHYHGEKTRAIMILDGGEGDVVDRRRYVNLRTLSDFSGVAWETDLIAGDERTVGGGLSITLLLKVHT
jgi:hypothetical protein